MSVSKAHALWHLDPSNSEIREVNLNPNLSTVRSLYSLVSLGTERLVATGRVPKETYEIMRVPYMSGTFDFPCSYGYSLVGQETKSGRTIHVMHPHQTFISVAGRDLFFIDEEEDMPESRLTLLSNMETAVNIFWDADPVKGEKILLLGAGLIGLLTASILTSEKIPFEMKDTDKARAAKASELGFEIAVKNQSYDLIIETTGNPVALQYAIDHAKKNARIIAAGWTGTEASNIKLGGAFHYNRLTIKSSQVSSIPPEKKGEWDFVKRKKRCLQYLKNDFYDKLIDNIVKFEDLPNEFKKIRKGSYKHLSLIVKY